ncbi:hypothetical protein BC332_28886 [Capsicum chinense]|nr:hypothetical protein BC332_28886 [Capsicum chinense]
MASSTILSRKIIKPSSPIPSSLRHHNLSFRDYIANPSYVPVASFYSKPENYNMTQISYILENSLSKILSSYYPFAGRIKDNKYVDCNDDDIGIEYLNVRVNCPMSEILNNPNNDAIDIVFPQDLPWNNSISSGRSLLVVQLSHFDCGGLAVSLCLSHKIADGRESDHATQGRPRALAPCRVGNRGRPLPHPSGGSRAARGKLMLGVTP